jgi:AraC family transcriptional regulator
MNNQEVVLNDLPQRRVLYMSCKGPWRQLPDMLTRLYEYASISRIETIGPPSGFYYDTPEDSAIEELRWEVCYPVGTNTPTFADDKLKSGIREILAARVASINHKGTYRKTYASYERLQAWIDTHSLKVCGPAEELYLTDISKIDEVQRIEIRLPVCPT